MKLREKQTRMTREIIKRTALGLFCDKGIENTDMSLIAETADVARRTLYHHYKDKEELAAEIYTENLNTMFGQLLPDFNFERPHQSLEAILDKYLMLREQSESLLYYDAIFNTYYSTLSKNPAELPDYKRIMEEWYGKIVQLEAVSMASDERAKWLEMLFMSTHLFFSYLQKAVIITHQTGGLLTEADREADRKFKNFIINSVKYNQLADDSFINE
ncbi:TetR/AcrR family transcriptional regulator [Paenibacillus sp. IHBB 10380]|uniref:TetR/AcrR family transcriptional regulator n=1 Tax=Paenibacillus sp. IHBB 10380 TaxID=1566358 RepID=UPI0006969CEB|nr:TetR/AcrR family transcriptional regulator [Paenibacillus sp. IHBB 10380]